jgi:peptidoglycan/LPS O-acetylase OafA/YrhL
MLDGASRVADATWKWVFLPLSVGALLVSFVYRNPAFRETFRYSVQGIALTPVFIAAVRYPSWGPFRLLNLPAMSFLGVLSYPLYLVHHVVLGAFAAPFGVGAVRALLALALSVAIAWAIHELVEKRCARLRRRLSAPSAAGRVPSAGGGPLIAEAGGGR